MTPFQKAVSMVYPRACGVAGVPTTVPFLRVLRSPPGPSRTLPQLLEDLLGPSWILLPLLGVVVRLPLRVSRVSCWSLLVCCSLPWSAPPSD